MYKEFFNKKKLVTFDLDGTIVKSDKVWDSAFEEVVKILRVDIFTIGSYGDTLARRWKQIIEANDIKNPRPINELVKLTQEAFIKHLDKLELTEGFWSFVAELKLLKKLDLALVTNTDRSMASKVTEKLELTEVFDFVICGDEVKHPKPDPEIYKKTLAHFKLSPKDALVFEDSLAGCTSAAKAGIKIICVWNGETPKRKYPNEVLDFTSDFIPFPGEMDTTYYEDIIQMAKEQKEST